MADTFKGIITADGKKRQLPYGNVLEKPVSDKTLTVQGAFADAKIVGDKFTKVDETANSLKEDKIDKPSVTDDGKMPRAKGGGVEWVDVGQPTDGQTENAVTKWLDKHPEATTTVQNNSLSINKMIVGTLGYVTPQMFGAIGDGISNDTNAIQKAVDSEYDVFFPAGTYLIKSAIKVTKSKHIYGCGDESKIIVDSIFPGNKAFIVEPEQKYLIEISDKTIERLTKTFNVSSTEKMSIGDSVILMLGTAASDKNEEQYIFFSRISSMTEKSFTVENYLPDEITEGTRTNKVKGLVSPCQNVNIENLTFIYGSNTIDAMFVVSHAQNVTIRNISCDKCAIFVEFRENENCILENCVINQTAQYHASAHMIGGWLTKNLFIRNIIASSVNDCPVVFLETGMKNVEITGIKAEMIITDNKSINVFSFDGDNRNISIKECDLTIHGSEAGIYANSNNLNPDAKLNNIIVNGKFKIYDLSKYTNITINGDKLFKYTNYFISIDMNQNGDYYLPAGIYRSLKMSCTNPDLVNLIAIITISNGYVTSNFNKKLKKYMSSINGTEFTSYKMGFNVDSAKKLSFTKCDATLQLSIDIYDNHPLLG